MESWQKEHVQLATLCLFTGLLMGLFHLWHPCLLWETPSCCPTFSLDHFFCTHVSLAMHSLLP